MSSLMSLFYFIFRYFLLYGKIALRAISYVMKMLAAEMLAAKMSRQRC